MRNLISWKPIYFHLSLRSGVEPFVLTTTEHSNIENSLSKKLHHEEDEHKGAFLPFLMPFLALSPFVLSAFSYCAQTDLVLFSWVKMEYKMTSAF